MALQEGVDCVEDPTLRQNICVKSLNGCAVLGIQSKHLLVPAKNGDADGASEAKCLVLVSDDLLLEGEVISPW